jgi:hypothetical protein
MKQPRALLAPAIRLGQAPYGPCPFFRPAPWPSPGLQLAHHCLIVLRKAAPPAGSARIACA